MKKTLSTLLIAIMAISTLGAQSAKRAFTIADLYRVQSVGGLALSPDGKTLAFNVTKQNLKKHTSSTAINLMKLQGGGDIKFAPMTKGKTAGAMWSPDGKWVYYTAAVSETDDDGNTVKGSKKPQVMRCDVATGLTEQVTHYELGVADAQLSPDGRLVAFTADVYPDLEGGKANAERLKKKNNGPVQGHIADELLYRHWTDYSDGRSTHIIVYDLQAGTYTDVTPGKWVSPAFGNSYAFSPDGKEICFVSNRTDHPEANTNCDLWTVPTTGAKEAKCLTADNEAWDGDPTYSPDGRWIAYRTQLVPGHESDRFRIAVIDRTTGAKRILTDAIDNWCENPQWSADSKSIYFTVQETGLVPLCKVDVVSGKITRVIEGKALHAYAPGTDGYIYYTYSTTGKPVALYRSKPGKTSDEQQLTFLNKNLEDSVDIRPSEVMWVDGADGAKIQVFVVKPHNFDPSKTYPLIINVHGGPQMQWLNSFRGDWQVYPGAGYVVAYPNPHGSTGYGQDFTTEISGDWGGKPYEDVMAVTKALSQLPYVDADRMGAMGWSYGGYFMNWLQAQKEHPFKCLASMMGLFDLRSMWGATEELWFPNFDLKGQPWNSELYQKWSPSSYVENFKTPTLIITGERDYRVSYTQSLQYFSTLQSLGIPSQLIVFSNDGHWPDTMKSMPVYYNAHLEWFHKWLGGDPSPWDTHKMMNNEVDY